MILMFGKANIENFWIFFSVLFFAYMAYADNLKSVLYISDLKTVANSPNFVDQPDTAYYDQYTSKGGSLFFQVLVTRSKFSDTPYMKGVPFYGSHTTCEFLLQNAAMMICFSVVFGYMLYIVIAFALKPAFVEDNMNPSMKVLLGDRAFRDSIVPPKLRVLYSDTEVQNSESTVGPLPNKECLKEADEKTSADQGQIVSSNV